MADDQYEKLRGSVVHQNVKGTAEEITILESSLDLYFAPLLKEVLYRAIERSKQSKIILNFEKVEQLDSSGLGLLINLAKRCIDLQKKLHLIGAIPGIAKRLQKARITKEEVTIN